MPQLDRVSYVPQVVWVLIRFFALYVCVVRGILPLLGRVLWVRDLKRAKGLRLLPEGGVRSVEEDAKVVSVLRSSVELPVALGSAFARDQKVARVKAWGVK